MRHLNAGRLLLGALVAVALLTVGIPSLALAHGSTLSFTREFPGTLVPTYARRTTQHFAAVQAPTRTSQAGVGARDVTPTATIQVTYHGFSSSAKAAFQAAVDEWQTQIVSSVAIHIDASWSALGATSGILGEAGPTAFFLGTDNFMYPAALAEARCSCNLKKGADIQAEFNSQFPFWYTGTNGVVPTSRWDLETVVLHELGHGLGFLSSFDVSGRKGYWGFGQNGSNYALRFDDLEYTTSTGTTKMTSFTNGSKALRKQLVDGSVFLGGDNVMAALGERAKLYDPAPWEEGSSNSHFDETKYPPGSENALMTPVLNNGEEIHAPGPAMLAVFRDIGWTTAGTPPPAS